MPTDKKPNIELRPTKGVIDYASDYNKIVKDKKEIIESARYFVTLRREHIKEIFDKWGDVLENMDFENAQKVLNEFLSPTCSLLEFEYKNLTEKGKSDPKVEEVAQNSNDMNEIWQKHILGQVLTNNSETIAKLPSVPIKETTAVVSKTKPPKPTKSTKKVVTKSMKTRNVQPIPFMFVENDESIIEQIERMTSQAGSGSNDGVKEQDLEVYTMYRRSEWFIHNVDIDTMDIANNLKKECKKLIVSYKKSFALTWRAMRLLCYLEILESLRTGIGRKIAEVFDKCSKLLDLEGITPKDIERLEECAHLFILKYRGGDNEEALIRCGFEYLHKKLKFVKTPAASPEERSCPYIYDVASSLAREEYQINQSYTFFETLHDFSKSEKKK